MIWSATAMGSQIVARSKDAALEVARGSFDVAGYARALRMIGSAL